MAPVARYGAFEKSIKAVDASLGGENIRIAHRRIVTASLKSCLAVDVIIAGLDVHQKAGLMVLAGGKVLYLWDLEHLTLLHKFGRSMGSVHRENIQDCKFDQTAEHIAAGGDDKRVVVWHVKTRKALKVLEGHKGIVYQVEFSHDGERIFSASDDGRLHIYDWRHGTLIASYLRHSSSIRTFSFFPERPDRVICGRGDGNVTTWDLSVKGIVDNIIPDPDWINAGDEQSLVGWMGLEKHHSGSIMSTSVSPNGRFLVTTSTDHTAKLWSIVSYMKDVESIQNELREANKILQELESPIDVGEERFDAQIKLRDFTGVRIGEVPIPMGYHADIVFTYRHEATVLCAKFNNASDIVITGSMDSTCRLWSCRRGDLLFQINVPAPVSKICVSPSSENIYLICQNRMLAFGIQASAKEEGLPEHWKNIEAEAEAEASSLPDMPKKHAMFADEYDKTPPKTAPEYRRRMTVADLKQLVSHGLVLPSFLETLLDQYKSIDSSQLHQNLKKYNVHPRQILRLIMNTKFHPKDIIGALSQKRNVDSLFSAVITGQSITQHMVNHGYTALDNASNESKTLYLDLRDIQALSKVDQAHDPRTERKKALLNSLMGEGVAAEGHAIHAGSSIYERKGDEYYDGDMEWYEDNQYEEDEMMYQPKRPTGAILHFIPSEQIKLLRDFHARREVKPIFMRQVLVDQPRHPNFNQNTTVADTRPITVQRAPRKSGVRFNEKLTTMVRGMKINNPDGSDQVFDPDTHFHTPGSLKKTAAKGSFASSKTVFKPDRYLHTRGLNVSFGGAGRLLRGAGTLLQGHIYAEPVIFRGKRGGFDLKEQIIVGKSMALKETSIDTIDE
ncbi:hypothetical protein HDV05_003859 [Chytridiales sp. JEL 0842]|nr:hypothetical protein HDV05_003859 [Chytridiales sp. JEL 0842]